VAVEQMLAAVVVTKSLSSHDVEWHENAPAGNGQGLGWEVAGRQQRQYPQRQTLHLLVELALELLAVDALVEAVQCHEEDVSEIKLLITPGPE